MLDLSRKTCLVYDLSGSYTFIAERMAEDFARVLYTSQWESGFSQVQDFLPGVGIEGVERVADPFDVLDDCDLVIFPDVGLDGLQAFLRARGMPVWGSERGGILERNRFRLKEELEKAGMDVGGYEIITGLPALREYLAKPENAGRWIKVCYFRGLTETHEHIAGFASEGWCDDMAVKLGPFQYEMCFLVEQPIDGEAVEPGIDFYSIGGDTPKETMWGCENKDSGYLGICGVTLPPRLASAVEKFEPILRDYEYKGPLSIELRITSDQEFVIDVTARFPSPPAECQCLNTKNFSEIAYQGARGIFVDPDYRYRYAAQFVLKSDVLESHPVGIQYQADFFDGARPSRSVGGVLIHGKCVIDGKTYAVSPHKIEEFAGAVGLADSLEASCEGAFEAAESVRGDRVSFAKDALKELLDTIEKGEKLGLEFG